MTEPKSNSTIDEFIIAIRMLIAGTRSSGVVRIDRSRKIPEASKEGNKITAWMENRPGEKVILIPELPDKERMALFVTSRLPEGAGMAMVGNHGLVAWGCSAAAVSGMIEGKDVKAEEPDNSGCFAQRVVLITGAGRGVGAGLAEHFFRDGANVVIAEVDEQAGKKRAEELNDTAKRNESLFIRIDITDQESVENMVRQTVEYFGGIDIAVSNAGVLKAGGLDTMTPEDFDFVNDVNYRGFFLLAKYVSAVMKRQSRYNPSRLADIIQINSKSGLQGSNRNFAYSGSKFGSIGLVQSFARELVGYGIKVNAVCPGNFFDLPLWSDPENGLFIQYLGTGKVPGARTVEEVRKYYENLVPMKRGCRIEDLWRAIKYIIGQQYETGQALPVTGGQVMLK